MKILDKLRENLSMVGGENILRRYFVMNGFDGALTALGIIIASIIIKSTEAKTLLFIGIGASISMGVSGFWIAYLTERAERTKELKELEKDMVTELNDTKFTKANFWTSLIIAAVDGISPFMFSMISISPFLFVIPGWITMTTGYIIAISLVGVEVIILGVFLGAISKENKLIYALKIIPAALIVAGLTFLLEFFNN